jgi:hypothetical protein
LGAETPANILYQLPEKEIGKTKYSPSVPAVSARKVVAAQGFLDALRRDWC